MDIALATRFSPTIVWKFTIAILDMFLIVSYIIRWKIIQFWDENMAYISTGLQTLLLLLFI